MSTCFDRRNNFHTHCKEGCIPYLLEGIYIRAFTINQLTKMNQAYVDELIDFHKQAMPVLLSQNTDNITRRNMLNALKQNFVTWDILTAPSDQSVVANLVKELLEQAIFSAIHLCDIAFFEFFFGLLRIYYFDHSDSATPSTFKYEIFSLHLIHLLDCYKFAEFHCDLELLSAKDLYSDMFLKYAVLLEQCLMEGNYNKIYLCRDTAPSPYIRFFVDRLIMSVRNEIASCVENSFEKLSTEDVINILHFDSQKQLSQIISERNWNVDDDGYLHFNPQSLNKQRSHDQRCLDQKGYILQFIEYATEIEAII
ncbi:hypothetical protein GJ496_003850 [Pomphorhynchus laevis]|nr:hypothetical protein GJ496_003850 [Pomphorhynchus laevis]